MPFGDVTFDINPTSGVAPLTVVISNLDIDVSSELDPFSIAHNGALEITTQEFSPFYATHFGYFIPTGFFSFVWDFGDGTKSTLPNPTHTYKIPGDYIITLSVTIDGITTDYITEITVFEELSRTLGIGVNQSRQSLQYGADETQGYGWSENSGDGHVWPDSKPSNLFIYNENGDHEQLVWDSVTGLPYVYDGRKLNTGSKVYEVFKDKVNPLKEDSGTEITSRIRFPEMTGSHESFAQRMSDISLFFEPMYRKDQDQPGFGENGLRDAFKVDLELYANEKLAKAAEAADVPLDRELFFDRFVEGRILQLAIEMKASQYRFTRMEAFLTNYDKARWIDSNTRQMTERTKQDELSNFVQWYSRNCNGLVDLVTNQGTPFEDYEIVAGADGYEDSGFRFNSPGFTFEFLGGLAPSTTYVWSTADTNPHFNGMIPFEQVTSFDVNGTTWYLWKVSDNSGPYVLKAADYFDLRSLSGNVSQEAEDYYIDDIKNNNGNINCPRWS